MTGNREETVKGAGAGTRTPEGPAGRLREPESAVHQRHQGEHGDECPEQGGDPVGACARSPGRPDAHSEGLHAFYDACYGPPGSTGFPGRRVGRVGFPRSRGRVAGHRSVRWEGQRHGTATVIEALSRPGVHVVTALGGDGRSHPFPGPTCRAAGPSRPGDAGGSAGTPLTGHARTAGAAGCGADGGDDEGRRPLQRRCRPHGMCTATVFGSDGRGRVVPCACSPALRPLAVRVGGAAGPGGTSGAGRSFRIGYSMHTGHRTPVRASSAAKEPSQGRPRGRTTTLDALTARAGPGPDRRAPVPPVSSPSLTRHPCAPPPGRGP